MGRGGREQTAAVTGADLRRRASAGARPAWWRDLPGGGLPEAELEALTSELASAVVGDLREVDLNPTPNVNAAPPFVSDLWIAVAGAAGQITDRAISEGVEPRALLAAVAYRASSEGFVDAGALLLAADAVREESEALRLVASHDVDGMLLSAANDFLDKSGVEEAEISALHGLDGPGDAGALLVEAARPPVTAPDPFASLHRVMRRRLELLLEGPWDGFAGDELDELERDVMAQACRAGSRAVEAATEAMQRNLAGMLAAHLNDQDHSPAWQNLLARAGSKVRKQVLWTPGQPAGDLGMLSADGVCTLSASGERFLDRFMTSFQFTDNDAVKAVELVMSGTAKLPDALVDVMSFRARRALAAGDPQP